MEIKDYCVVELCYELEVDGKIVDKTTEESPLDYIQGTNMLIPKFEENLRDKEVGYCFDFIIKAEQAYGPYDPKYKFEIPKDSFMVDGKIDENILKVGNVIPMLNSSNQVCHAQIVEIGDEDVTVDFNHTLAGKDLHFVGKVLSVRQATDKELTEGLHGEFVSCGCGCGEDHDCGCGEYGEEHECGCGGHHHGEEHECCCGGHGHHHHGEEHECCCGGHEHKCECGDECDCNEEHDCGCGGHHHHGEEHECCCGGHEHKCECGDECDCNEEHDCGCGGHHKGKEHECCCSGHVEGEKCNCPPDCDCRDENGECHCGETKKDSKSKS